MQGKPYAGNPHVRFDEGEVAPAATPRRGSLLYKRMTFVFAAACIAGTALAATRYWNPTVQWPESTGSSTMRYFWEAPNNWLDEDGNTGVPEAGDDVILAKNAQMWGGKSPALNSLKLMPGCATYPINQTTIVLSGGGQGFAYTATSDTGLYSIFRLDGDGDVPFDVPAGKSVTIQKAFEQSGTYTEGATLVKKGEGTIGIADGEWTQQCTYRKTRLEAGLLKFEFYGRGKVPMDYFPVGHDFLYAGNDPSARLYLTTLDLRMKDVKFHEREDVVNTGHGITASQNRHVYLRFTGTPQLESTVFSGSLYNSVGISWETEDPAREFVFSNAVSATTGGLLVSNGTMRVVHGASFTALSNMYVAAGAAFKVEKGAGAGFSCQLLDLEDSTAEVHAGEDVVLSFRVARVGGAEVAPGVYTSTDLPWVKGLGRVRVGEASIVGADAPWWERADGPTALAANAATNYLGVRLSGEALSFTAGAGALAFVGAGGFETAGDGAAYTWGWPTYLEGVQTWNVAEGDTLEITGALSGVAGAAVRKVGAGKVKLTGAKDFPGDMVFSNGTVVATGDDSLGGAGGTTTFELISETEKGVLQIEPEPGKSEVTFHRPVTFHYAKDGGWGNFLILPANTTVNFYGLMSTSDKPPRISGPGWPCHWAMSCPDTTTVHWYGGMYAQLNHQFPGGHHYIHKALTGGDRFFLTGAGTVVELLAPGNSVGGATGGFNGGGTLYTRVPYALVPYADNRYQMLTLNGACTIDLCGNDQELSALYSQGTAAAVIRSDAPALLHLSGTWHPGSSNGGWAGTATNRVKFVGGAGLSMEKNANYWLYADCTTTGTLQVTEGRVTMTAGKGFWTNATEAVVKGGALVLEHAGLGTNTVVRFVKTDDAYGSLELASGVKQQVAALEVDGVEMPMGLYGSSATGARYRRDDLFAGTGLLKVGEPSGLAIIIR